MNQCGSPCDSKLFQMIMRTACQKDFREPDLRYLNQGIDEIDLVAIHKDIVAAIEVQQACNVEGCYKRMDLPKHIRVSFSHRNYFAAFLMGNHSCVKLVRVCAIYVVSRLQFAAVIADCTNDAGYS